MITARDALNRSYNLLGVGIVAISGLAFASDLPAEIDQFPHIIDEILLLVLAVVAVAWYLLGLNKYSRTVIPIVFAASALVIKIVGIILEIHDAADVGDEFGAVVLFVATIALLIWQYVATQRLAAQATGEVEPAVART